MISNFMEKLMKPLFVIIIIAVFPAISLSEDLTHLNRDSLYNGEIDTAISPDENIDFQTYRIVTKLSDEPDYVREQLYNLQTELGIQKGKELEVLEIYIDKTPKDKSKWNVIINDTSLQFLPTISWDKLTQTSKELLDNWTGRNNIAKLTPDDIDTIVTKKNEMFSTKVLPLVPMNEDSKLSELQKDYSYEIFIMDDYPEQVDIEQKQGLIFKRVDKNIIRVKLSRFNRATFEKWADGKNDDPYFYITSITLYDKVTNQKSRPINLKFTFGEY